MRVSECEFGLTWKKVDPYIRGGEKNTLHCDRRLVTAQKALYVFICSITPGFGMQIKKLDCEGDSFRILFKERIAVALNEMRKAHSDNQLNVIFIMKKISEIKAVAEEIMLESTDWRGRLFCLASRL